MAHHSTSHRSTASRSTSALSQLSDALFRWLLGVPAPTTSASSESGRWDDESKPKPKSAGSRNFEGRDFGGPYRSDRNEWGSRVVRATPELLAEQVGLICIQALPDHTLKSSHPLMDGMSMQEIWVRMFLETNAGESKLVVRFDVEELGRRWFNEDEFERYVVTTLHAVHGSREVT